MLVPRDPTCENILQLLGNHLEGIPSSELQSISGYKDRNFYNHIKHLKMDRLIETYFHPKFEKDVLRFTPEGLLQSGRFEQEVFLQIISRTISKIFSDNEFGKRYEFSSDNNHERIFDVANNILFFLAWQELKSGYPWVSLLPQIFRKISTRFSIIDSDGIGNNKNLAERMEENYLKNNKNKSCLILMLDNMMNAISDLDFVEKKSWSQTISILNEVPSYFKEIMELFGDNVVSESMQVRDHIREFNYLMSRGVDPVKFYCGIKFKRYNGENIENELSKIDSKTKAKYEKLFEKNFGKTELPIKAIK